MIDEDAIRLRWEAVGCQLDERGRRLFAAAEVRTAGWGGLAVVSRITGLARSTINRGEDDLDAAPLPKGQVRRAGGGRRAVAENDPGAVPELEAPGRARDARRSHAPVDLGVEEHGQARGDADGDGPSDQRRHRAQGAGEARLLAPVQPQGRRGLEASRSQRAVRAHQRQGRCRAGRKTACHLRRHEEEGAGRQLQERRHGLSPQGRSPARERARLRGQDSSARWCRTASTT